LHDGQAKDDRINFKKIILTTNATFYWFFGYHNNYNILG
jgi:hypothetical protein